MDNVSFDGVLASNWGLYLSTYSIEKPTPKTVYADIPFGDGALDLSEASGEIRYNTRKISMSLQKVLTTTQLETLATTVANTLHGKKVKIKFDKDPNYYYWGRVNVGYQKSGPIGEILIEAICDAYKYKNAVTTRTETITLASAVSGTQIITNGDFTSTTGWTAFNSTLAAAGNVLSVTGTGSNYYIGPGQNTMTYAASHSIYIRCKVRVTNSNCSTITAFMTATGMSNTSTAIATAPIANQYYTNGVILNTGTGGSGSISVRIYTNYPDAATANGKVTEIQYLFAMDLTAAFGAGKEPTAAQMDAIMSAKFTNSWFTGTQDVISAVTNKVITITNDRKTTYPKITTSSATSVLKDGVTYSYDVVTGFQTVIPLLSGTNTLTITPASSGDITLTYQEGAI